MECKENIFSDRNFFFIIIILKGVLPTAQRAAIVCGVELAVYDWIKKQLICRFNSSDTIGTHFISSFTAGLAGALASTPIDVVRVSYDGISYLNNSHDFFVL